MEAQNCEPVSMLRKGQRVGTFLWSFKITVLLPQQWLHLDFEQRGLLSQGIANSVANIQTLCFRNREVDVFLLQIKSMDPAKFLQEITMNSTQGVVCLQNVTL